MITASSRSIAPALMDGWNGCNAWARRLGWSLARGAVAAPALLWLLTSGCGGEKIQTYSAPKDKPATAPAEGHAASVPPARPRLSWQLPKGWKELGPGKMSLASFSINGGGGAGAQVTVTPLARLGGRDVEVVNMWREQLGLDPLAREEIERQFENVTVGGETGRLFRIEGKAQEGSGSDRVLTVIVHRADASWFYKLAGDAGVVEAQKPAFLEFLRTLQIQEGTLAQETPGGAGNESKPAWQVPSSWSELPAGQMQVAKFAVPARGPAKAEVSISRFPTDTGGTLANVNRWRRQLGLGEVGETELAGIVSTLDPSNPEAKLVELAHEKRRLVGAIVPRSGTYWFYKLVGDAEAVAPEKDAFVRFAQSNP